MRRNSTLIVIVAAALMAVAAACGGGGGGDSLAGSTWKMIQLGPAGFPVPAMFQVDVNMELSADGTTIKGSGGCNGYSGSYAVVEDAFTTSNLSWTEIGCTEPEGIFEQENRFFGLLASVETFFIQGDKLTLNAPGDELLVFLRTGGGE
jgi:heat shock protein HslJ